ncbi:MAG: peptidase [Deltaproteobacteria bacterium]|jgi:hypothetical protein|nr:peptidase [Deltaproteobacteria bacterium]MBW2535519.1 peptidase [Deltaproteobacteria bacterium]
MWNPSAQRYDRDLTVAADVDDRLARLAPTVLELDEAAISAELRAVLRPLVEATGIMQEIFLRQIDPDHCRFRRALAADPSKASALRYYDIMAGPWDILAHDAPFIGADERPHGAGFYPPNLTKAELERHLELHPDDREAFEGYFNVIERRGRELVAVPYSAAYRPWLERAAAKLDEAAGQTTEPSLERFLELRARAFLTDDYVASDMAWMDVEGPIEITIGPYETYADQLFAYKASFESFLSLRDAEASRQLAVIGGELDALEHNLPLDEQYKQPGARGDSSPIDVVHLLCNAGQPGVQTVAYALPNDEQVRDAKGTKKVLLKNVMEAKFEHITKPIAAKVLAEDQLDLLDADAFFTYILMHEVAHGVGPGFITLPSGERTSVGRALRDTYAGIEEAKADITGLVNARTLIERGVYDAELPPRLYVVYLATAFRQMRFGVKEAHGKGVVCSLNLLLESGGMGHDSATGRFRVNLDRIDDAVRDLSRRYLTIEATGDYDGAAQLFERYAKLTPEIEGAIARIGTDVPVDIAPSFPIVEAAQRW